jgi:hypothetical protein
MTHLLLPLGLCLIIVTICYVLVCAASPWGTCRRRNGRNRTCMRCDGTGMRPRIGCSSTPTPAAPTATASANSQQHRRKP